MATALDTARFEASAFFGAIARVKALRPTRHNRGGSSYTVYEDTADPNLVKKNAAVCDAVDAIAAKGLRLPAGTRFYLVDTYEAQNRAFHFDPSGNQVCWITLGRTCVTGGSGNGISAPGQATPGFTPEAKITVHEIGHTLHAHGVGLDEFFKPAADGRWKGRCACAGEVSAYAGNTKKEFVAEVFLGRMVGRTYSLACMKEYADLAGPAF